MISITDFFAQGELFSVLDSQLQENRLPHALLITGEEGLGKFTLAKTIAGALLCEGDSGIHKPCGKCRSCLQMEHMNHPDLLLLQKGIHLTSDDRTKVISADDIGVVLQEAGRTGFQANRRVIMIRNAEDMTDYAQNRLLKTLEEPQEGIFFLLTSTKPDLLLTTIISRCRRIPLHEWPEAELIRILKANNYSEEKAQTIVMEAEGSPGRALRLAEDEGYWSFRREVIQDFLNCAERANVMEIGNKWKDYKDQSETVFSILDRFFSQMIRICLSGSGDGSFPADCPDSWKHFVEKAKLEDMIRLTDALKLARERTDRNVQFPIIVEQLIFTCMEARNA